ncbi:MAG: DUF1684 domain-containing protein [Acidobacteriota bacterium]|jgi:uncharacterized protein (DUF1684 family)|nr:DUF1684 domain-containing protein [Acidobacteriota bacterium]
MVREGKAGCGVRRGTQGRASSVLVVCLSGWLAAGLLASGCSEKRAPSGAGDVGATATKSATPSPESHAALLLRERQAKDDYFRSVDSPLPAGERTGFQGLSYYPVEPSLRFQVRLRRYQSPKPIRMATNTGEIRSGLLYGFFEFAAEGRDCQVKVYRLEESAGEPALFIPFLDATSGTETYEGGRYLDLTENTTGEYDLDFNRAYNPYCAYNPAYSCPAPPKENTLPIPIRAGERRFSH